MEGMSIIQYICIFFIFFVSNSLCFQKRAAESRIFNQECVILNFYDYHDVWHFLSATSLFFSFMVNLSVIGSAFRLINLRFLCS